MRQSVGLSIGNRVHQWWLCAFTLIALWGCGSKADLTLAELVQASKKHYAKAEAARENEKPKKAMKVAEACREILALADARMDLIDEPTSVDSENYKQILHLSKATMTIALLAEEEARLDDKLTSWRAKGYRGSRKLVLRAMFKSMAVAADAADADDSKEDPETVTPMMELAVQLSAYLRGEQYHPDEEVDWSQVAKDLRKYTEQASAVAEMMAMGFMVTGRTDMALYEIHLVNAEDYAESRSAECRLRFMRGTIYALNDMPHLSFQEFEHISTENLEGEETPLLLSAICLFHAGSYLGVGNHEQAEAVLAKLGPTWSDHPVSDYLDAELLAAQDDFTGAAQLLERRIQLSEKTWLTPLLADRAQAFRQNDVNEAEPFSNKRFIQDISLRYLVEQANDVKASIANISFQQWLVTAKGFGQKVVDKFSKEEVEEEEEAIK